MKTIHPLPFLASWLPNSSPSFPIRDWAFGVRRSAFSPLLLVLLLLLPQHSFAQTATVSFDKATGHVFFSTQAGAAQFANWDPTEFKIGGTQLVATGKTVSFANSLTIAATSDGFTFTVPGTGTAALLGANNTFSGSNSFSGANPIISFVDSGGVTTTFGSTGGYGGFSVNRNFATGAIYDTGKAAASAYGFVGNGTSFIEFATTQTNNSQPVSRVKIINGVNIGGANDPGAGNLLLEGSNANLFLKDLSTGFASSITQIVNLQTGNAFRNASYTSGIRGWSIDDDGSAEFENARVRGALYASQFTIGEITATAGTQGVFYSAATLHADFTTPAAYGSGPGDFTFIAKNSDAGASLLNVGDYIRFKTWTGSGISDSWAWVGSKTNNGSTTTYTAYLAAGSQSATFHAGSAIADYGPSGSGFITLSADGTVGASPNLTMATHAGSPWSAQTTLFRAGNLNGSYGYASTTYGVGIGQYGVASEPWWTWDLTNGIRVGNNTTVFSQWFPNGDLQIGQTTGGLGNVFLTAAGTVSIRRGTTDYITLSPTDAQFTNLIKMTGANAAISLGTTPPTSATAGTGLWMDRTGLYSLSANTQNATLTANGFTAGGGNVIANADGLSLVAPTSEQLSSALTWKSSGTIVAGVYNSATGGTQTTTVQMNTTSDSGTTRLQARSGTLGKRLWIYAGDGSAIGSANILTGVTIGRALEPSRMLDVYGTGWFQSLLSMDAGFLASAAQTAPTSTASSVFQFRDSTSYASGVGGWFNFIGKYNSSGNYAEFAAVQGFKENGTDGNFAGSLGLYTRAHGSGSFTRQVTVSSAGALRAHGYGAGTLTTDAPGNITTASDETLKTIDGTFDRSLADLRGLKPKKGHWNAASRLDTTEQYVWLTAQDRLQHIPESVFLAPDGTLTAHDGPLHATYVNAFNEIADRLEALEAGKPHPPRPKDTTDRKALAADRLATLKSRLAQREEKRKADALERDKRLTPAPSSPPSLHHSTTPSTQSTPAKKSTPRPPATPKSIPAPKLTPTPKPR